MQENIWVARIVTVDIAPGSTISDLINKLTAIKDHNLDGEFRVVEGVNIRFSDKTKVELENRLDKRELCGDDKD